MPVPKLAPIEELGALPNVWAIATYIRPDGWYAYVQTHDKVNILETVDEGFGSPLEAIMDLHDQYMNGALE